MKLQKTVSLTALVLAATVAGSASANISTGSLGVDVQSAVSAGHVSVVVTNGVATLFGGVESIHDAKAAEFAAASFEGIEQVRNRIFISN